MEDKQFKKLVDYVKKDDFDGFFGEDVPVHLLYKFIPHIVQYKAKKISKEICRRSFDVNLFERGYYVYEFIYYIYDSCGNYSEKESIEVVDLIINYDFTGIELYDKIVSLPFFKIRMGYPLIYFMIKTIIYVNNTYNFEFIMKTIQVELEKMRREERYRG